MHLSLFNAFSKGNVKCQLVQLAKLNNFCGHDFFSFCENFCTNLEIVSYRVLKCVFIAFCRVFKGKLQEQTCSAAKTEQLSSLQLFTLLRKFLRKNTKKLKRYTFFKLKSDQETQSRLFFCCFPVRL